jgi:hypothetical protein
MAQHTTEKTTQSYVKLRTQTELLSNVTRKWAIQDLHHAYVLKISVGYLLFVRLSYSETDVHVNVDRGPRGPHRPGNRH